MKSEKIAKTMGTAWVHWMFFTLFFIGIPSFAYADINDILLKFNPYIAAQETYSNNILLTKTNKLNDFITTVYPGLEFSDFKLGSYGINLDFVAGYTSYAKNHDFSYFSPAGNLDAWYAMNSNLTFRVRDYVVRSDAAREQIYSNLFASSGQLSVGGVSPDLFSLSTERGVHAIYVRNVVQPSVEYHFGQENLFSVLYRNNTYSNQNTLFQNSQENTVEPILTYWFDVRNGITLDYHLTSGTYSRSPDQLAQGARARYTYRFDPRLSIFGEYYFEWENFKSPGVDYDVHNPSLGVTYRFSPTLTGTLQGGYYWEIPAEGTTSSGPFYLLSLVQTTPRTTYTVLFQGGYTEDYFTAQNLGFVKYYKGYGTINHRLTERMNIFTTGSVERVTLPSTGEKDWIWIGGGGVSYSLLRWLTISLSAYYTEDHSNLSGFGYKEYRIIAGLTLGQPTSQHTMMGQPFFPRPVTP